ncbi:MAG: hypothetical protein ACYS6K_26785 [Planctomycetota bacterium]
MRAYVIVIVTYMLAMVAHAQYSGGTGEPNDPYLIATAEDLMLLGESPEDYDKHFILTADIDLDPNLPDRKVFDKAVIAPSRDTSFTGVFDGNGHTISRLSIKGIMYVGLFGQTGDERKTRDSHLLMAGDSTQKSVTIPNKFRIPSFHR